MREQKLFTGEIGFESLPLHFFFLFHYYLMIMMEMVSMIKIEDERIALIFHDIIDYKKNK